MCASFISELCLCVCVCVCARAPTHTHTHVHWNKCACELSELAGREMEEWTLNTWKSLCKVQRSWGSRSTDILANGPGISPVEQAVRVNRHVSVNVDPWAERWGRQKAPGGSPGGCQGSEKQSGPDSQAQKRGYAQPLRHLTCLECSYPYCIFYAEHKILSIVWWVSCYRICLQCGRPGFDPGARENPLEKGRSTPSKVQPLQYPGLENCTDCIVYGVTKSRTQLSNSTSLHFSCFLFVCFVFETFEMYFNIKTTENY